MTKKLVIGVDGNEANVKERVGTGQYAREILSSWSTSSDHIFHIYLREAPLPDMPQSENIFYHVVGPKKAWTRFALPLALKLSAHSRHLDVFWSPAHYLPPLTASPSVVTVHDLAYEYFPDLFLPEDRYKLQHWTRRAVSQATRVIAVSESTKNDLVKLYETPEEKIPVVYNGYDSSTFSLKNPLDKSVFARYGIENGKYILFLGTIQPRKNAIKLVQAFHLLKDSGYKGKLVIAGRIGWMAEETLKVVKSSPDLKDIVLTGYVDTPTRAALYRGADVYVLPSLYEGFGVPAIEAMASGVPVAVSENSSLPEVVSNSGIYFNPSDPAGVERAIYEARANRETLVKRGLREVKRFSWDKCAKETLSVLESVAKKGRR